MKMVGHDHAGIGDNGWIFVRQFRPPAFDHPPGLVRPHLPVHHIAEKAFPPLRHNGDEIGAGLGVIVPFQPDRTAVVFVRIVFHTHLLVPAVRLREPRSGGYHAGRRGYGQARRPLMPACHPCSAGLEPSAHLLPEPALSLSSVYFLRTLNLSAAYARAARTSSSVSCGYASRICAGVTPSARLPTLSHFTHGDSLPKVVSGPAPATAHNGDYSIAQIIAGPKRSCFPLSFIPPPSPASPV
jgi:hypothetical protein